MEIELNKQKENGRFFDWAKQFVVVRWLWLPLLLFIITRLGIVLVAYVASPLINDPPTPPYHLRGTENVLLDVFASRWDTGFYISIAEEGYKFEDVSLPSVAFFPLLPLIMRAVTPLVGDAAVAGILISNLALLLTSILLYRLTAESYGSEVADRAVWYLLIFPTAFFGTAIYTESLFLLTAIGALYFARHRYWESAALFGIAAGLTRFIGVIVVPLLLLEWLQQWQTTSAEGQRPSLFALPVSLTPLLGLGAFMLYLQKAFGDPLAFVHASEAWGRVPQSPFVTIADLFQRPAQGWATAVLAGQIQIDNWIDFSMITLFLGLGLILLYKKRWSEAAFVLLGTLIPFSSGLLMSQRRYVWVLFPVFILLAQWGHRPWLDKTITALSLLGLALFTALFVNGYWVG